MLLVFCLEKLVNDKPSYKGKGGLTQKMRCRLTSAARCAIKMRSKEPDTKKAIKLFERDLQNGPFHCFGHHQNCSPDFCLTAKESVESSSSVTVASDGGNEMMDGQPDELEGMAWEGREVDETNVKRNKQILLRY